MARRIRLFKKTGFIFSELRWVSDTSTMSAVEWGPGTEPKKLQNEAMQIAIDKKYFAADEEYPDVRLFIETIIDDGSCFRATAIRIAGCKPIDFGEGGFFVDRIGRVKRPLPLWPIKANNHPKIERLVDRYNLDLSVG